jgi:hypothetical protein
MDITTLNKWAFGFFQWIQRVEEIKRLELSIEHMTCVLD